VLYVEDNPSNIKLVEQILGMRSEVTLLVATQGGLALELAREHLPALVLLDLNLPDIPGEEVLRRLRRDPRTAAIPIVVLSADATPGQIARLRRAGADDYLTKPFDIDRFNDVIDGTGTGTGAGTAAGGAPAAMTEPVAGPINREHLGKLRRLYAESEPWNEFLAVFREDSGRRLADLTTAARAGDSEAVWQAAHALTGSCNLVGAQRVLARLDDIAQRARTGETPGDEQLAMLQAAFAEAGAALDADLGA
jgi:CheY-like chemotaxis protein